MQILRFKWLIVLGLVLAYCATDANARLVPFAGMGMNETALEEVETRSSSPLGLFGVRYESRFFDLYAKHLSSIPDTGIETRGLNLLGGSLTYDIGSVELFAGRAWHSEAWDGAYYSEQFSEVMEHYGIRVHFRGDRVLFIERIDSLDPHRADLVLYGFEILFIME